MSNIRMNQPSRFGALVGRRYNAGKLQIISYVGKDQTSGDAIFDIMCHQCGKTEQVGLSQLQSGTYRCSTCHPQFTPMTARQELEADRRKAVAEAQQKRVEAEQQAVQQAEKQRQQRNAEIRQRQQALVNEVFGTPQPEPPKESEPGYSATRTFRGEWR